MVQCLIFIVTNLLKSGFQYEITLWIYVVVGVENIYMIVYNKNYIYYKILFMTFVV